MENLDLQDILFQLGPNSGLGLGWNILLYLVFFFTLIAMFLQSDKTILPTLILAAGMLMTLIAKLSIFDRLEFGTFIINAGLFLAPTLVFGMTKAPKSRPFLIFAALIGAIYFFAFWFVYHFRA